MLFEDVLQPAIRLAEEGFVIKKDYHGAFRRYEKTLNLYRGSRKHFFKADGSPYSGGEVFQQPALAAYHSGDYRRSHAGRNKNETAAWRRI